MLNKIEHTFETLFIFRPLTPEQRAMSDAIIVFCVKETDMFGVSHRYNAECYLSFNEITDITGDVGKVQQILMPLTRPTKTGNYKTLSLLL